MSIDDGLSEAASKLIKAALFEGEEENEALASECAKSASPAHALALHHVMSWISEETWCAGWLTGLGHSLWDLLHDPQPLPIPFGLSEFTSTDRESLAHLHEKCGGWWAGDNGARFVPSAEWAELKS